MSRILMIQLARAHPQGRLPYPFYVNEQGEVLRQDFWQGYPLQVVGFQREHLKPEINLWWEQALADPQQAVGMYLVTSDADDRFSTHGTVVDTITEDAAEGGGKERGA